MQRTFSLNKPKKLTLMKQRLIREVKGFNHISCPEELKKSIPAALFQRIDIKPCQGKDKVAENAMLEQVSQLRIADKWKESSLQIAWGQFGALTGTKERLCFRVNLVKISLLHFSARSSLTGAFIHFARERKMPANELRPRGRKLLLLLHIKSGWEQRRKREGPPSLSLHYLRRACKIANQQNYWPS
jgi:hypothetical protein